MKLNITLTLVGLFVVTSLPAQPERQAENWHFGDKVSITFRNGFPERNGPSAMQALEGAVSFSDTLGNLLFYSNGGGRLPGDRNFSTGYIWNRNHEVMYDMRGSEGGGFSARQSSIAMPDPARRPGIYYLFTMEEAEFATDGAIDGQPVGRGLSYFEIDILRNDGLGEVTDVRQQLYTPAYEGLDATPMADGSGYWLICHDNTGGQPGGSGPGTLAVLPFTAAGVGPAVETRLSFPTNGRIEFSPHGRRLYFNGRLFAFDPADGTIGAELFAFPNASSGACFTPDSRYLYYTEGRPQLGQLIVRYDLSDFSKLDVARLEGPETPTVVQSANLQIAPNGNIYFAEQRGFGDATRFGLSEIDCVSSPVPTVNRLVLELPVSDLPVIPQTLPQFVDAIFARPPLPDTLRLDTLERTACLGEEITLRPRETGTAFSWSAGTAADTLVVSTDGQYCVTVTGGCQPTIDCQRITFRDGSATYEILETVDEGCTGQFYRLSFTAGIPIDSIRVVYRTGFETIPPTPAYYAETFMASEMLVPFPECGAGQSLSASVFSACPGAPLPLDFPACGDERFRPELTLTSSEPLCTGLPFTLEVTNPGSLALEVIRWQDDSTQNPRSFRADRDAVYATTVFSECGDSTVLTLEEPIAEVCDCKDEIPELITPNGDNVNDVFRLFSNCPAEDFTLLIYDRWGQLVFQSSDPENGWNGEQNGTPQNMGTYLYRMAFRWPQNGEVQVREGQFSLLR